MLEPGAEAVAVWVRGFGERGWGLGGNVSFGRVSVWESIDE